MVQATPLSKKYIYVTKADDIIKIVGIFADYLEVLPVIKPHLTSKNVFSAKREFLGLYGEMSAVNCLAKSWTKTLRFLVAYLTKVTSLYDVFKMFSGSLNIHQRILT